VLVVYQGTRSGQPPVGSRRCQAMAKAAETRRKLLSSGHRHQYG